MNKKAMRETNSRLQLQVIGLKEQVADWKARYEKLVRESARREIQLTRQVDYLQAELAKMVHAEAKGDEEVEAYRKVLQLELNRPQPAPVHIMWTEVNSK